MRSAYEAGTDRVLYLDVCCLNRPFDDQIQERVRLESEAVLLILGRCQRGEWQLVGSEAIALEINQTRDSERKAQLRAFTDLAILQVMVDESIQARSDVLAQHGLGTFDVVAFGLCRGKSSNGVADDG